MDIISLFFVDNRGKNRHQETLNTYFVFELIDASTQHYY